MRSTFAFVSALCLLPVTAFAQADSATELMRQAREARATWDDAFPGFTADLAVMADDQSIRGRVTVSAQGKVELEGPAGPALQWAKERLQSDIMHRKADASPFTAEAEFAEEDGKNPLGRLIRIKDDKMSSSFRVREGQILEVNRTMRDTAFSIKVLVTEKNPEGKVLPSVFTVTYWDGQSRALQKVETYHVTSTRLGRYDLPGSTTQVISENKGAPVRRLVLSNHRLAGTSPAAER
jgi:hypothetical protein